MNQDAYRATSEACLQKAVDAIKAAGDTILSPQGTPEQVSTLMHIASVSAQIAQAYATLALIPEQSNRGGGRA